ncbi:2'-5' RNA ligase family protein [Rhodococcus sp. NPDC047139]|uniref:2'-5' RNA ligase family protein n=1 Tax=Rhodococcus sp. NPDC047139 TaxID=3155141 RepID=UPI0033DB83C9
MVQSVELLLDAPLDAAVRDEWARLLDAGIHHSQGRVRSESNRPHVTLFVARILPPELEDATRAAITVRRLSLRLGGVVVFGGRYATLARTVVPSIELLELHARIFEVLAGCSGVPEHIRPGEWTPHVTLARRVPAARVGAAVIAAQTPERQLAGSSAGVRRWDGEAKREWLLT